MTSRHLFFKAMREDLRHKIWMIALSSLGSFLVLPVAWLLSVSDRYYGIWSSPEYPPYVVSDMFHNGLLIGSGFIAIAGAVIVGLFGFRFVFHKNMIDTYHSIPVKRRTLYGVCWLNGILIWLVPFLTCLLVTLGMATVYLMGTPSRRWIPAMWAEAGANFLILAVVFLLVYHLVLTAVMVSGNVWNTLVSMMILGFGVVCIYGLGLVFFGYYIDTFYSATLNPEPAFYGSPLLSAVLLIYWKGRVDTFGASLFAVWRPLLINFCIMAFLGILSGWLYMRRASELAEQGIRNKVFSAVLKFLVGLAGGMGGWMLFYLMVDHEGWGVFGLVLVGVLAFGVMDVIFSMEFKAFFAHKLQMVLTVVCALAVCFCFYLDVFGYDTYLPDKEDIAEIAIYHSYFTNTSYYYEYDNMVLNNLQIQDTDAAYDYLKRVTDREKGIEPASINGNSRYDIRSSQRLATRVTLKNGRTYYRSYTITNNDLDVVWPLLSDEEYLEWNYVVHQNQAESFGSIRRYCYGRSSDWSEISEDTIWTIAEAYNRDLLENPETVLLSRGKLLVSLELNHSNYDSSYLDNYWIRNQRLEIYESMENTIAALEQLGYGNWVEQTDSSEISEIQFSIGNYNNGSFRSVQDLMNAVRNYYGVYEENNGTETTDKTTSGQEYGQGYTGESTAMSVVDIPVYNNNNYLSITSEAEIRELMQLLNRQMPQHILSAFHKGYVQVNVIVDGQEESATYFIRKGDLPEKYILRFGELFEQMRQEQESNAL